MQGQIKRSRLVSYRRSDEVLVDEHPLLEVDLHTIVQSENNALAAPLVSFSHDMRSHVSDTISQLIGQFIQRLQKQLRQISPLY